MNPTVRNWGFADAAGLWPQTIRILIVIDGRINETKDKNEFGLGYVLETLRTPFAWWVRFHVDVERHEGPQGFFKFTNADFDLDDYDQLWFFGDRPNKDDGDDGAMTDNDILRFALSDAELKMIAQWMDRGGGVFATGDHTLLGASKCSRIPRVRTMRRWTLAQHVPPRSAGDRHETLQPTTSFDAEIDTVLQPIELVQQRSGAWPFVGPLTAHPLFHSTHGLIDRFPDHMHEGEVIADDEVLLDLPLDIPGYTQPEYPYPSIVVGSAFDDVVLPLHRPHPRIVAYGHTTNRHFPDEATFLNLLPFDPPGGAEAFPFTKRFGLVGVYDGDAVNIGRIVVDSTWHHWLSINLHALATAGDIVAQLKLHALGRDFLPPHEFIQVPYAKMQAYYRNVGLWLATPAQRRSMLIASAWGMLVNAPPMEFGNPANLLQIGERALHMLKASASQGVLAELVNAFVDRRLFAGPEADVSTSRLAWPGVQAEQVNRAVVGGIGSALLPIAMEFREQRRHGLRPRIDAAMIHGRAIEGASLGNALLKQSIVDGAAAIEAILTHLRAPGSEPQIDLQIPIKLRRFRVAATKLQIPDPRDPALVDGCIAITLRIKLGSDVVADCTLERAELPPVGANGVAMDLDVKLGKIEAYAWECLTVEVLAGRWSPQDAIDPEAMRFEDILHDDPAAWIGEHTPARSHAWRLWYRIEDSEAGCDTYSA